MGGTPSSWSSFATRGRMFLLKQTLRRAAGRGSRPLRQPLPAGLGSPTKLAGGRGERASASSRPGL